MASAVYGSTNENPDLRKQQKPRRYAEVIELNSEKEAYYRELHADAWPHVLKQIEKSGMRNYSIHIAPLNGKIYLFASFEYWGNDFEKDMKAMASDPETQRWWKECGPCQIPLENRKPHEWWMSLEEVFYFSAC